MIDRRKEDRRKDLAYYEGIDRRLCKRRAELVSSAIHAVNEFEKRRVHTRGLDLNAIHLNGRVVV
jgi:hypothetical protein